MILKWLPWIIGIVLVIAGAYYNIGYLMTLSFILFGWLAAKIIFGKKKEEV